MPVGKIFATKRGKAGAVAAVAFAAVSGWTAYTASKVTSARPEVTPAIVRAAIDKGLTPPAVRLAVDKLIKPWEGRVLTAHWDPFAKIYDICYGETLINGKPVQPDMKFTPEECDAILATRVVRDYFLPLVDGVKNYTQAPYSVQASLLSGAYNFGTGAAKKSKAAGYVTTFKYDEACAAQTAFNKAGGQVVNGLVKRREMGDAQRLGEAELCLSWREEKK